MLIESRLTDSRVIDSIYDRMTSNSYSQDDMFTSMTGTGTTKNNNDKSTSMSRAMSRAILKQMFRDRFLSNNSDNNKATSSSILYVAVPLLLENKLLQRLDITAYSNDVKVAIKRSEQMEVDRDVRSKKDVLSSSTVFFN